MMANNHLSKDVINLLIRIVALTGLISVSVLILSPFASIIAWSIILAMALTPTYSALSTRLGSNKMAATLLVLMGLAIIFIPSWLFVGSIVEGVREISRQFEANTLTIPPPVESVKTWPLIGERLFDSWTAASENLNTFINKYADQLGNLGNFLLQGLLSIGGSIGQFIIATIIAGVLLVTKGTRENTVKLFNKLLPGKGTHFSEAIQKTVNNVVKGVLGVGLIQSFLVGIGLLLAGVPYAGLWTLIVFVLAVLQLPVSLVTLPVIIYLFSYYSTLPAILWTIYLVIAGLSDNLLKPILLGKGAPVPMLVIFMGVIGGFIALGFIGLFIGAIILSVTYKLYEEWINQPIEASEQD